MADQDYRTDDLALAVVLALASFPYQLIKITDRKVLWQFTISESRDEEFEDLLQEYGDWCYKVEPRAFVLRQAEMREEIFQLIPKHVRRSVVSPATAT